jgi:hypothetical protein
MTTEHDDTSFEPPHTSSPTDHVLTELRLYGYRPFQDEPDPRPMPDAQIVAGAVADIFDALAVALGDTRLEPDLEDLLWSTVNIFHRAIGRTLRELDDNGSSRCCLCNPEARRLGRTQRELSIAGDLARHKSARHCRAV